ncbi:archaellin/type IV pilin N-terminal domain-containing protein [Vulcanisaeta sp. JCM 14467]|uniref:archaellin/type IV pilin N-terminal domain-containing protein n=1 Tax=Vulcanisaeta sp. JCM 14467 TaxID=1295370 RepID=UPI0006D18717|nr:archaellin/type IV pilin N-terminal domain-containing protein [Vulcanisaeta sp. JCM 14467]
MTTKMNRKGISNVVATIILIAVAIALAVAVAVWVFGIAGSAAKTAALQIQSVSLTGVSSGSATLTLLISNPSSSGIGIVGFTLGGLSCTFSTTLSISSGAQGPLTISLQISSGAFTSASQVSFGNQTLPSSKISSLAASPHKLAFNIVEP